MAKKAKTKSSKQVAQVTSKGFAHIKASYTNTQITLTNQQGQVIAWSSGGKVGYKGTKKNTPYAARLAAQDCSKKAYSAGLRQVEVYIKGISAAREAAIRSLYENGIEITTIRDITPKPFNGCRARKSKKG